jgi:N-acetylglucosamine-6-phosphate deacetylase
MGKMEITANIVDSGLARISIQDGFIQSVKAIGGIDRKYPFVGPGFVDIQINGIAGVDFSAPNLTVEQATGILEKIWQTGVTSICATLVTNNLEALARNFQVLEKARRCDARFAATVPCYHLEGPYLSPGGACGAHDPTLMRFPDWKEFLRLQEAAGGNIAIVTLAPELPGAPEFIRRAYKAGIVAAIGHTDAKPAQIHKAVRAGASLSTHLGNGCATQMHRHLNPIWAQIAGSELSASLICDGFHLPPDFVRAVYRAKGIDRCILITDAVQVATMPPGEYQLAGTRIRLLPNGKVITADGHSMAGSSVSMSRAIAVFRRYAGASLGEALQAATLNPAKLLGRPQICSAIALGQPANLTVFRAAAHALRVEAVLLGGERVYRSRSEPDSLSAKRALASTRQK